MKKMFLIVPTYRLLNGVLGNEIGVANQSLYGYRATDNFMVHHGGLGCSDEWQLTHIPTRRSVCCLAYWRLRRDAVAAAQALEGGLDWNFIDPSLPKVAMQVLVRCVCRPLACSSPVDEYGCTQKAKRTERARQSVWLTRVKALATEPSPTNDVPPKGEKNELRVDGST